MKHCNKCLMVKRRKARLQFEPLESRIAMAVDVSGEVFWDANRNGLDDDSASPDSGVVVSLVSENGSTANGSNVTLTLSGNSSNYQLSNISDFSPNPDFLYDVNAVSANLGTELELTFPLQNTLADSEVSYDLVPGTFNTRPSWLEAADLDGVNGPDIIVANFALSLLTIRLNDGTGEFSTHIQVPVPANSTSIDSVDFDSDGDIDLVVGNLSDDRPAILVNDGNASFTNFEVPTSGSGPFSVVAADVNADNRPDIITSNVNPSTVSVYLNQSTEGQISFAAPNTFGVGRGSAMIAAVNLTGQPGLPNLVVLNTTLDLLLTYDNDGSGGFTYNPTSAVSAMGSKFLTAGFIDEDAFEDVALYAINQQEVPIYFGDASAGSGNGGFDPNPTVPQTVWYPVGVGIADTDADGDNDLVAGQVGGRPPAILRNDGGRNVTDTLPQFGVPLDAIVNVTPALADFDGNGVLDIAYSPAWNGGTIRVSLRQLEQGDHVFPTNEGNQSGRNFGIARTVSQASTIASDYDGDGTVDGMDLAVWLANHGSSSGPGMSADGNSSGRVDGIDFLMWQRNFSGSSSLTAVGTTTSTDDLEIISPRLALDISSSFIHHQRDFSDRSKDNEPQVPLIDEIFTTLGNSSQFPYILGVGYLSSSPEYFQFGQNDTTSRERLVEVPDEGDLKTMDDGISFDSLF